MINHWLRINDAATRDNILLLPAPVQLPEDAYRLLGYNYIKFFKMDVLSKWAWLGAEALLAENGGYAYDGLDKTKIAVVLMTNHGCLDVDKKYQETLSTIPSPALFVYTLSNIMLGEICIRHGFKGEQLCLVSEQFDTEQIQFWVNDLLTNRGMDACLCGWVDAASDEHDICLFWVSRHNGSIPFNTETLQTIYKG